MNPGVFRRRIDARRAREFSDTAKRFARERAAAADTVEELIASTRREQWSTLAERAALQTYGALEKLGSMAAAAIRDGDPQRAIALAEIAVSSAEGLPANSYPDPVLAQLRAHAWNDYARALLSVERLIEALHATDAAYGRLAGYGALAHDRAIVGMVRAETLHRIGRGEEALVLLAEAIEAFREHGDDRRAELANQLTKRIRVH